LKPIIVGKLKLLKLERVTYLSTLDNLAKTIPVDHIDRPVIIRILIMYYSYE